MPIEEKPTPASTVMSVEDRDALKLETALGHKQQMQRNFGLLSLTSLGIVVANAWSLTGGTIVIAIFNGGPMAVLYGLILVTFFYTLISLSLSELISSIPSSGGVYHIATITGGPRYGRILGFYTGLLNISGWLLSAASISSTLGNELVALWNLTHPAAEWKAWHVFIAFQLVNWSCCAIVITCHKRLPAINTAALWLSMGGLVVTVLTLVIMPRGRYASSDSVWRTYEDRTGWNNDGICFILGLINAAFAVGTPDSLSHLSEEIPNPERLVPRGILLQLATSFTTAFIYLVALFYSINDLEAVLGSTSRFPTAEIYRQATGSTSGAVGLTVVLFLATFPTLIGTLITGGRTLWSLARDGAVPGGSFFAAVSPRFGGPVRATIAVSACASVLSIVYIFSTTAFSALITSYIVLSSLSYAGAIGGHVATGRKAVVPGPFWLGRWGWAVNLGSLAWISVMVVFFCWPFVKPVTKANMNWTSVIVTGLAVAITGWWLWGARGVYKGPRYFREAAEKLNDGTEE
ncbi:uncharacterized protein H6S33_006514 [Morchella sextelata]|uniref:uncharacterized protein n=1 Tax=Morchella sextelata TaxID=1174677 RepID=UPI001D0498FA|nr:uncharacterized protein H6S33_006514 [Morchella sextelata]KAH0604846.1 hypothetical protein H6S33_006514 [Morchella sextelata]